MANNIFKNSILTSFKRLKADLTIVSQNVANLGEEDGSSGETLKKDAWFRLIFQAIITLIGIGGGFYLLLSKEASEDTKKFGSGLIGLVIGFWLR
jgi:hypothetical protein